MRTIQGDMIGSGLRFAIIGSRFNELITSKLIEGAKDALSRHGVSFSDIDLYWTPGAWEQPDAAPFLAQVEQHAAPLALYHRHRGVELRAAVAAQRAEQVSGEAL